MKLEYRGGFQTGYQTVEVSGRGRSFQAVAASDPPLAKYDRNEMGTYSSAIQRYRDSSPSMCAFFELRPGVLGETDKESLLLLWVRAGCERNAGCCGRQGHGVVVSVYRLSRDVDGYGSKDEGYYRSVRRTALGVRHEGWAAGTLGGSAFLCPNRRIQVADNYAER